MTTTAASRHIICKIKDPTIIKKKKAFPIKPGVVILTSSCISNFVQ